MAGVLEEADPVSPLAREARANKTVVICAGHDATHTGASGNGLKEEELTFKVAQYCKQALEQYQGVTVYMDRDSISCKYPGQNTSYCLNQRIKDAAALGATVFVDIHFNTGGEREPRFTIQTKAIMKESIRKDRIWQTRF